MHESKELIRITEPQLRTIIAESVLTIFEIHLRHFFRLSRKRNLFEVLFDVCLDAVERSGLRIAVALSERLADVLQRVFVAGHFVATLSMVSCGAGNLVLTLKAEAVAHLC